MFSSREFVWKMNYWRAFLPWRSQSHGLLLLGGIHLFWLEEDVLSEPWTMKRNGQARLVITEVSALLMQRSRATSFHQALTCQIAKTKQEEFLLPFCIKKIMHIVPFSSLMLFSQREERKYLFSVEKHWRVENIFLKTFYPYLQYFAS